MILSKKSPYQQAIEYFSIKNQLAKIPLSLEKTAQEIRFRVNRQAVIMSNGALYNLNINVTPQFLMESLNAFCDYSLHSYERELSQGYITLRGGHRAGFCGTAVYRDGKVTNIKDISSINLRIANQRKGCAEELFTKVFEKGKPKGLLICGAPLSGKTTVLRDLCVILGERYKLCVIDERGEIGAVYHGQPQLDIGTNTDILDGFEKRQGIMTAVRAMSPQFIVCDEIGEEAEEISHCMNSGVGVILTAHCDNEAEAKSSKYINKILDTGAISHVIFLDKGRNVGKVREVWELNKPEGTEKAERNENCGKIDFVWNNIDSRSLDGDIFIQKAGYESAAY